MLEYYWIQALIVYPQAIVYTVNDKKVIGAGGLINVLSTASYEVLYHIFFTRMNRF